MEQNEADIGLTERALQGMRQKEETSRIRHRPDFMRAAVTIVYIAAVLVALALIAWLIVFGVGKLLNAGS